MVGPCSQLIKANTIISCGTRDSKHPIRTAATKRWRLTISTHVRHPCELTHPSANPAQPGLTSELVCLLSLFSTKTPYFLVAVDDTCTHWVPSYVCHRRSGVEPSKLYLVPILLIDRFWVLLKARIPEIESRNTKTRNHSWDADWSKVGNLETLIGSRALCSDHVLLLLRTLFSVELMELYDIIVSACQVCPFHHTLIQINTCIPNS